jgi:uncharacterized protein (DUF342 family)
MKKLLFGLTLLICSNACALLPEDEAKMKSLKDALRECEEKVEQLQKEIAQRRETIAREGSAMTVREAESRKKMISEPMSA